MIKKKYLFEIFIWIAIVFTVVAIAFAIVLYRRAEKTVIENTDETNRQSLSQIVYNVTSMDDYFKKICTSVFYNPDAIYLMNIDNIDNHYYDSILKMQDIKSSYININQSIFSIYIYNAKLNMYFSSYKGINFSDTNIQTIIENNKYRDLAFPVYRNIEDTYGSPGSEKVFTYAMSDFNKNVNQLGGTVFVNIKANWVFDNIWQINMFNRGTQDKLLILDENGEFIDSGTDGASFSDDLKTLYYSKDNADDSQYLFERKRIEGGEYYVSVLYMSNPNWVIIRVQPYQEVYRNILILKNVIIIISVIMIIIIIICSLLLSKKIYNPIGELIKTIMLRKEPSQAETDEITFLRGVYQDLSDELSILQKENNSVNDIQKKFFYRRIMIESSPEPYDKITEAFKQFQLPLCVDKGFIVCLIKLDNYNEICSHLSYNDKELIKFAIVNISEELFSSNSVCDFVNMEADYIIGVFNTNISVNENFSFEQICDDAKQVQIAILENFGISVTLSFSEPIFNVTELGEAYKQAAEDAKYRFIIGKNSIVLPEMVRHNIKNSVMTYSTKDEIRFIGEFAAYNIEKAESALMQIIQNISTMNFSNITISVIMLIKAINGALNEQMHSDYFCIAFDTTSGTISGFETIAELQSKLIDLMKARQSEYIAKSKNSNAWIATIKELVESNYADIGLCSAQIAEMLHMSSSYITRLFKAETGLSLSNYINDVRLEKAYEFLESTNLNIRQVMVKVGIDNESHFYRLFKKKYGVAPRKHFSVIESDH